MAWIWVWAVAVVVAAACADSGRRASSDHVSLNGLFDAGDWIGSVNGTIDNPAFSLVQRGRFSLDGSSVVLLDRQAPFVSEFDRAGELRRRIVAFGDGPGEAKSAYGIAQLPEVGWALLHGRRLSILSEAGAYRRTALDGLFPFGLVSGCGGMLLHAVAASGTSNPPWLQFFPAGSAQPSWEAAHAPREGKRLWIRPDFLVGDSSGFVFLDEYTGARPVLSSVSCDGVVSVHYANEAMSPAPRDEVRRTPDGNAVAVVTWPDTLVTGIGLSRRGFLWSERIADGPDSDVRTELNHFDEVSGRITRATYPGRLMLLDSRPGDAHLFATNDPFPRAIVVSEADLRGVGLIPP